MTRGTFLSREPVWTDADFVGRNAALRWLAGQLGRETPQNCNIVGEPRVGKTSLLHAIHRCQVGLPVGLRGIYVWARLVEWADRQPVAFWTQLADRLRAGAREAGIPVPSLDPRTTPADSAWTAYRDLERLLEIWQSERTPIRVIVLVDDFELLLPGITAQGLDWLRALATRFAPILAFVLTTTDPLEQVCRLLEAEQVSPLPNIFATHHLGLLSEEETLSLIHAVASAEGRPALTADWETFLRREAGRHPDLLKLGCDYLFQAQDEDGEVASPIEIMAAVRSDMRYDPHVRWLCERLYARRTEDERRILLSLARDQAVGDPMMIRRFERKLGLVESREGNPTLFADACRYWVVRHQTSQPSRPGEEFQRSTLPDFHYEAELHEIRIGEQIRKLSVVENRLFQHLWNRRGLVCSTQELLDHVWGAGRTPSVVEKTVNRLRDKVEEDPSRPRLILSARGEGYLLRAPESD
jgi:DNA-binding response OmpR family regulator